MSDRRSYYSDYDREQRATVIAHYGKKCECCGERRTEFLGIDHIFGGGKRHRMEIGMSIYRWLTRNGYPKGYRLLCHNCNLSQGFYGYCPHEGGVAKIVAQFEREVSGIVSNTLNDLVGKD